MFDTRSKQQSSTSLLRSDRWSQEMNQNTDFALNVRVIYN